MQPQPSLQRPLSVQPGRQSQRALPRSLQGQFVIIEACIRTRTVCISCGGGVLRGLVHEDVRDHAQLHQVCHPEYLATRLSDQRKEPGCDYDGRSKAWMECCTVGSYVGWDVEAAVECSEDRPTQIRHAAAGQAYEGGV